MHENKHGWGTLCALIAGIAVLWSALLILTPVKAHADLGPAPRIPGPCAEAYVAPHSERADQCRRVGWTIHVGPRGHGIIVSPHAVVRYLWLPTCTEEDGSGQDMACTWNLQGKQGNGKGLSYWVDRHDRTHYVWRAPMPGWAAIQPWLADSLAEAGYDHTRWERWRYDTRHVDGRLIVRSPGGRVMTID